ncbi:MAG: 5-formyltetrahydrofolate cyclo-ligase [Methanomicrobiales archaeon]|nr:5-formyltetrahydrofolate cyclo-ligase [Methanomicrobiales archaeon]
MSRTKAILRLQAKEARSYLSSPQISLLSRIIERRLLDLVNGFETIMAYASKVPEVDTRGLINGLNRRGVRVVVPIIERETCSLRLSYLPDPAALTPSTFNVPEPLGHELPARPEDVQVVIVPMLAFDAEGNRLGYGAGYYDRFLSRYPHLTKIGVAFSCQQTGSIPIDDNDVKMDYIVTEKGVLRCNGKGPLQ